MEQAQASGVRVTVMNHIERILNLPHVSGTCVGLPPQKKRSIDKKKENYNHDCVFYA